MAKQPDVNDRLRAGSLGHHRSGAVDIHGRWSEPEPLSAAPVELPPFPVEALPEWMAAFVGEVARDTQTDSAAAAVIGLACLSTAAAKRCRVEVKPSWTEGLNLYIALVMEPSEGKSPVYDKMTRPLREWEREQRQLAAPLVKGARQDLKLLERRHEWLMRRAISGKTEALRVEASADAKVIQSQIDDFKLPRSADLLVSNITPEKLKRMLAENGGRMALMTAEGSQVFGIMTGLYSKGQDNLDVFLESYSDPRIVVHRLGREPDDIPYPALTMALAIQPGVLQRLASKPQVRDLGLLSRFLWSIPPSRLGSRDVRQPAIAYRWAQRYDSRLRALLELETDPDADDESRWRVVKLGTDAYAAHLDFRDEIEREIGPYGRWAEVRDVVGKLAGRVARIAALLHLAALAGSGSAPWETPIDGATMEAAIAIGRWSIPHALQALGLTAGVQDEQLARAQRVLGWVGQQDADWLTQRELYQGIRNWWRCTMDDLRPILNLLCERGYLKRAKAAPGPKGGAPGTVYEVNPLWTEGRRAA